MVGRYQLLTPLASGGMAEIWLARQPGVRGFEKLVVIKRMVGALEEDPEHIEMFLSEARLAAQLTHPNIVQVYELGEENGSFYIVMEFVDGEPLSGVFRESRRQGKPLSDEIVARLISWAAEGLHYAHTREDERGRARCIVHRDVSPQNLLVTMDGTVKVVDFGIAKVASHATSSGKLKGKLAYMAPEQGRAESVDARTDVFALGLCLFELVTRTRLLPKADEITLLRFLTSTTVFPRASERRAGVPPALDEIIARAMAAQPEDRFQSARELQVALEDWLVSTGSRTTAGDVAVCLRSLFAERIASRKALIESAKRGEILPGDGASFRATTPGSGSSNSVRARALEAKQGRGEQIARSQAPTEPRMEALPPGEVERSRPQVTKSDVLPSSIRSRRRPVVAALLVTASLLGLLWVVARPGPQQDAPSTPPAPAGEAPGAVEREATAPPDAGPPAGAVQALVMASARDAGDEPEAASPPDAGAPSKAPPARALRGTLRLNTVPWSTVYLGGKRLGETPLLNLSLPAGTHVFRVVNSEQNIDHTIEIDVVAGEVTTKTLQLQ
jgi:serine/threonine protein kinase